MTTSLEQLIHWTEKQAPPGLPPREGLQWKPQTHRWIRPKEVSLKPWNTQKLKNLISDDSASQKILDTLSQHGKPYLVGGGVRDSLLGYPSKDMDIEVYGIDLDSLSEIVERDLGGKKEQVGKQFGVFKVGNADVALPRTETKTGTKHTDFDVKPNPNLALEHAARRRDFTINALMYDYENDEILDFFNGKEDIASRTIKHIDDETFVEDPLRVYRAAQFASRLGFSIDPSTKTLARSMDLSDLPKERVFEELTKLLLKSSSPSVGLQALDDLGVLDKQMPELKALQGTIQRDDYHAEGDVFTHTKLVIDNAARISKRFDREKDQQIIMLAALCHDIGKPTTTDEKGSASEHSEVGIDVSRQFLSRLTDDKEIIDTVSKIVGLHLIPLQYYGDRKELKDSTFKRLINRHGTHFLDLLSAVSEADGTGRLFRQSDGTTVRPTNDANEWFRTKVKTLTEESGSTSEGKLKPLVTGKSLIDMGFGQGVRIGEMLQDIQRLQEDGTLTTTNDAKKYISDVYKSLIEKQAPPGPPPRRGLVWKPTTHRWIRPHDGAEFSHEGDSLDRIEEDKENIKGSLNSKLEGKHYPDVSPIISTLTEEEMDYFIDNAPENLHPTEYQFGLLVLGIFGRNDSIREKAVNKYESNFPNRFELSWAKGFLSKDVDEIEKTIGDILARSSKGGLGADLIQVAAKVEFGLEGALNLVSAGEVDSSQISEEVKSVFRGLYNKTQDFYSDKGLETIKLYRGLSRKSTGSNAVESWTKSRNTAKEFASGDAYGAQKTRRGEKSQVLTKEFQVSNIIFSFESNPSLLPLGSKEKEVVILNDAEQDPLLSMFVVATTDISNENNLELQAPPPSGPPRPGLQWKPTTHRWIRPAVPTSATEKFPNAIEDVLTDIENDELNLSEEMTREKFDIAFSEVVGDYLSAKFNQLLDEANVQEELGPDIQSISGKLASLVDEDRKHILGERASMESYSKLDDWIEGKLVNIIGMRHALAEIRGEELDIESIKSHMRAVIQSQNPDKELSDDELEKSATLAIQIGRQTVSTVEWEGNSATESIEPFKVLLKREQEYTLKRTKELFGDSVTVHRALYGDLAGSVRKNLEEKGSIEIESFPMSSYTMDPMAAYAFGKQQGEGQDFIVFSRKIPAEDILFAWYSHPAFLNRFPHQKELVINPKELKFKITKADIHPATSVKG